MIAAPVAQARAEGTTDASLVEAVRHGDDAAFGELYRRHQPEIARFVRGRVRDHGSAEDVTQDAFLSALRRMRQTDAVIAFRPWIFEIARNATIDCYRRSSRIEEVSIDAEGMPPGDAGRLPGGPQPELSLVSHESFDSLREALHELSDTHRRVIVLRELEGRSYREIGDRLHLSQAAVESTLFRARRKLEHEYTELDSGRRCRLVGAAIGRLADGLESDRDRRRLDRHARRCSACRRRARTVGVEPVLARSGIAASAAALLPLPAFLRRRLADDGTFPGDAGHSAGVAFAPAAEVASGPAAKAVALLVTAVFVGGGGATLGGAGPLAPAGGPHVSDPAAPGSDAAPARRPARDGSARDRPRPPAGKGEDGERNAAPPKRSRQPSEDLRDGKGALGSSPKAAPGPTSEPAPPSLAAPRRVPSPASPSIPDLAAPSASGPPPPPSDGALPKALPSVSEAVPSAASAPVAAAKGGGVARGQES